MNKNSRSKIKAIIISFLISISIGCVNEIVSRPPIVSSTTSVTYISNEQATSGGIVSNDNGGTITARGICWSTNPEPTIKDSLTINGCRVGMFVSLLKNLKPNTIYYVRAYASNLSGTAYGNTVSFKTTVTLEKLFGIWYGIETGTKYTYSFDKLIDIKTINNPVTMEIKRADWYSQVLINNENAIITGNQIKIDQYNLNQIIPLSETSNIINYTYEIKDALFEDSIFTINKIRNFSSKKTNNNTILTDTTIVYNTIIKLKKQN